MGLSASQAKLLSITARISSNELRAQDITRAKTRLTDETDAVHKKYTAALDNKQLTYLKYDEDGNQKYVNLTGHELTSYAPLKNQYGLINSAGQILVSEKDGANYQDSNNLNEFLEKYGFKPIDTGKTYQYTNPAYTAELERYNRDYNKWLTNEPEKTIKIGENVIEEAWTERVHTSEIYKKVMETGCITGSLDNTNCYMHVLASLLGEGHYTTSNGNEYDVYTGTNCEEHEQHWCWNTAQHPVDTALKNELKTLNPCGEEHDETVDLKWNGSVYKVPCKDEDCNSEISVYQKIIDLLWEVHEDYSVGNATGGQANTNHIAQFWHIIEFDLDEAEEVYHPEITEDVYGDNPEYQKWLEDEPAREDIPEFLEEKIYTYSDNDEAQWYINLWHRMNGASSEKAGAYEAETVTVNGKTQEGGTIPSRKWNILEDGLMNNSNWLQQALQKGTVTLEKVNFTDPTKEGSGLKHATWTSIIYSSATEISEEVNEERIAKAEAEFEEKTKIIEAKDKQYDSILKLLDTEHSALQDEYDSVKNVISKNIDRTLRMYSA